ncbi:MAG: hypothetical protein R3F11_17700 [Verrucomicrobiales bacterium]
MNPPAKLCLAVSEGGPAPQPRTPKSLNKEQKEQSGSLSGEWKDAAQAAAKVMADSEEKLNAQQARIPNKLGLALCQMGRRECRSLTPPSPEIDGGGEGASMS